MSDQTPEPYTPTTQLPLRAIKKRYAEATKVTNDSGSLLELYAESAHDVPVLIAEVEKLRRALVRGAAHDREVAARAQAEIAKALDRLRVPEYCVTGDQKEAYRWALNRAHATARDYDKAGESQND